MLINRRSPEADQRLPRMGSYSPNLVEGKFYEVRCCAQNMEKDCPPSWISGRMLQGRGRQISNSCGPTPDVVHARPADHREGGRLEIVTARSFIHHTLPEGQPLCPLAQSALWHIHPLHPGVWCDRYP